MSTPFPVGARPPQNRAELVNRIIDQCDDNHHNINELTQLVRTRNLPILTREERKRRANPNPVNVQKHEALQAVFVISTIAFGILTLACAVNKNWIGTAICGAICAASIFALSKLEPDRISEEALQNLRGNFQHYIEVDTKGSKKGSIRPPKLMIDCKWTSNPNKRAGMIVPDQRRYVELKGSDAHYWLQQAGQIPNSPPPGPNGTTRPSASTHPGKLMPLASTDPNIFS